MTKLSIEQQIDSALGFLLDHSDPEWHREVDACISRLRAALTAQVLPEDGNRLPLEEIPEGWCFQKLLHNCASNYECWLINSGEWRHFCSSGQQSNFSIGRGSTPTEALRAAIAAATAANNSAEN